MKMKAYSTKTISPTRLSDEKMPINLPMLKNNVTALKK